VWDCAGKLVRLSDSAQYYLSTLSEAIHVPAGGWFAKPDGLTPALLGRPIHAPDDVRLGLPVMAASPTPQPAAFDQGPLRNNRLHLLTRGHRIRNRLLISSGALVAVLAASSVVAVILNWPFTRAKIEKDLEDATFSTVVIYRFQPTYFPHPGGIATGVTFRRNKDHGFPPLLTVQKLTIQANFLGLLTKHISVIRADGAHVTIPPLNTGGPWLHNIAGSKVVVDDLVANGAILDFTSPDPGKSRITLEIHEFVLHSLGSSGVMPFQTGLFNPEPPGEVRATGSLGPWKAGNPAETEIFGSYSFRQANLGVFNGIAGILSSDGKFKGILKHLGVDGSADMPDFEVTSSGHPIRLGSQFHAVVNAINGDVELRDVSAHFGNTTVVSKGSIVGRPTQKGKTASLDMVVREGRIQDLLLRFIKARRSPLTGIVSLTAHASLPPGQNPFRDKLELQADFGIGSGHFTRSNTQQSVNQLSERAEGEKNEDPESVLSDVKGHVVLKDGIANLSSLSFGVPGAVALMHGTYDLSSQRIDLRGVLHIQAKLSDATTGMQSFLIKALNPFLKNNHPGANLPVHISGTYSHPVYRLSGGSTH
jgi:AsmA-like C-terminal region